MILMRHRAVLLGLVGGLTSLAAFLPQYQNIAFAAGFISVLSYIWLMMSVGGANPQLQRVFAVRRHRACMPGDRQPRKSLHALPYQSVNACDSNRVVTGKTESIPLTRKLSDCNLHVPVVFRARLRTGFADKRIWPTIPVGGHAWVTPCCGVILLGAAL